MDVREWQQFRDIDGSWLQSDDNKRRLIGVAVKHYNQLKRTADKQTLVLLRELIDATRHEKLEQVKKMISELEKRLENEYHGSGAGAGIGFDEGISRRGFLKGLGAAFGLAAVGFNPFSAHASDYKEVKPEEIGLRIEYGPTSTKPKHNPNKRTNPDWHTGLVRFYDVLIHNSSDMGYHIQELNIIATDSRGKSTRVSLNQNILNQAWGKTYVPPRSTLLQPDRWAGDAENDYPIRCQDIYHLKSGKGNSYQINDFLKLT